MTDYAEIAEPALSDGEMLRISVKHKVLARDQWNLQQATRSFKFLARNAVDERMTFQYRVPNGWEIFSLPHQFGAHVREIIRSF